MLLPTFLFLLAALCDAASRSNLYEASNIHGITSAPGVAIASIPTITLAPVTNFNQSLVSLESFNFTFRGTQIELITDVPSLNGDALIALGPDAAANLKSVYQENCVNGIDSPCEASLQAAMNVHQQILEKRVPIIIPILVAVMAIKVGIEYVALEKNANAISKARLPSADIAAISPVLEQGARTVVIATQTSGGNLITAFASPTVDTTDKITIASVTADSSLAQEGDYIYGWPVQPGFAFYQFVQTYGKCTFSKKRSCNQFEAAGAVAGQAIGQVQPGGVLNDLIPIPTDISLGTLIPALAEQLPAVLLFGRQVIALAADSTLLNAVATFLPLAAYTELTTPAPNPTRLVIRASDFVTTKTPQETGSNECPWQIPNCSNCGGNQNPPTDPVNTTGICVGLVKYDNSAAGCVCVNPNDPPLNEPYQNDQEINEALAWLSTLAVDTVGASSTTSFTTSSTTSSTTTSASSSPSVELSSICNNDQNFNSLFSCEESCFSGTCKAIDVGFRRCVDCSGDGQKVYQCSC